MVVMMMVVMVTAGHERRLDAVAGRRCVRDSWDASNVSSIIVIIVTIIVVIIVTDPTNTAA